MSQDLWVQSGYTGNYLCDFVAKVSTLATFFLRFFQPSRRQFKGHLALTVALATRQKIEKIALPVGAKNHSCSRSFTHSVVRPLIPTCRAVKFGPMCDAVKDWHQHSFRASGAINGCQKYPLREPEIKFSFFIFGPPVAYF